MDANELLINYSILVAMDPYLKIGILDGNITQINRCENNLRKLLIALGKSYGLSPKAQKIAKGNNYLLDSLYIGEASRKIKLLAKNKHYKMGHISKKQVIGLIETKKSLVFKNEYISIPYYSKHIFASLVSILEDKKQEITIIDPGLMDFVGKTILENFYIGQTTNLREIYDKNVDGIAAKPSNKALRDILLYSDPMNKIF